MADLVKLPVDSPELQTILLEIPHDDGWDMSIPLERGYAKAGLSRYSLEAVKALTSTKSEESYKEEIGHTKSGSVNKGPGKQLELADVKAENPLGEQLSQKITVAESGKLALEKVFSQSQDLVLALEQKMGTDPAFQAKKNEIETLSTNLGQQIQQVRQGIFKAKNLTTDQVTKEVLDQFCISLENWSTLLEVARSQVRKANQLLSK